MKKLINKVINKTNILRSKINIFTSRIQVLNDRIKKINMSNEEGMFVNPYTVFASYLIDALSFGALTLIVINCFYGWLGWANLPLLIGVGFSRNLILGAIKDISNAIKGKE